MKKNFIEVYDDMFEPELTNHLESVFFNHEGSYPKLEYNQIDNLTGTEEKGDNPDKGLGNEFYFDNKHLGEAVYLLQPFYHFCFSKNINPLFIIKGRYYLQHPTNKIHVQPPHVDIDWPHWVFLYYVNDSEGETVFYNEQKEEIKRVTPKKGRACFFDGSIYHSASTPNITSRAVININFIGKPWK
tara:strand:- start:71 stop:628 length:558 start_codon:yes stop_codon:yes gene_type:complete